MISLISDLSLVDRRSVAADASAQALPPGGWVSFQVVNGEETATPLQSGLSDYGLQIFVSGDSLGVTADVAELDKAPVIDGAYHAITDQYTVVDGHTPTPGEGLFIPIVEGNEGLVEVDTLSSRSGIILGVVLRALSNYEYAGVVYSEVIEYVINNEPIIISGTGGYEQTGFGQADFGEGPFGG